MLDRDSPPGERPMKRLARAGPNALRDAELLAIILGGQASLEDAEIALREGLARLENQARNPLLPEVRQARIVALLELVRRFEVLDATPARVIHYPHDVAHHLVARYSREPQERLGVILLDTRQRILAERIVYIGQHDSAHVSPRWILKHAFVENADALILFHNHPTGDPSPSPDDSKVTEVVRDACNAVRLTLFDHIIVGRKTYYSYREAKRL